MKYDQITFAHPDYEIGCGGNESPFEWGRKTYLYVWNKKQKVHEYYCFEDDLFYSDTSVPFIVDKKWPWPNER